jgi:hypothetical protein
LTIPLRSWAVDPEPFIGELRARGGFAKAATDRATVYRPLPVCRLIDTRGNPAAITVGGPLAAGSTTIIDAAGHCGIPTPNPVKIAGISLSFHVLNLTPNNGGFISFLEQLAPINGVNAVFNPGAQWTAATANVSIPSGSGDFEIYVAQSIVQVVVDVNGYYQDVSYLDVSNFGLPADAVAIEGDVGQFGTLVSLNLAGQGKGTALDLSASAGTALSISHGAVRSAGAGVGSDTFATIHQVNTAGSFGAGGTVCGPSFPAYTVVDNSQLNSDPNAIMMITPRHSSSGFHPNVQYEAFYYTTGGGCVPAADNHWMIHRTDDNSHLNGLQFNLLIIKP